MKNLRLSIDAVNAQANATGALYNDGCIEFYDSKQPADPDLDFEKRSPVATIKLGAPAFPPAIDGEINLYPVAPVVIPPPGNVTWARALTANYEPIMDMSVDNVNGSILAKVEEMQGVYEFTLTSLRHKIYRDNSGL